MWRPNGRVALPELREATAADIPAMLAVFFEADEHLRASDGRPPRPRQPESLRPYFEHHLRTDPATSWVADDHGRIIAFGMVMVRDHSGFLSELFVIPRRQGRGLGRTVLERCLGGAAISRLATCADAGQPGSTALYASRGLAPRTPIYILGGPMDVARLPEPGRDIVVRPLLIDEIAAADASVLGYTRPQDHALWQGLGREGWTFWKPSGELLGYGYMHPGGRLGPVLALDPARLLSFAGYLARSVATPGSYRCFVPGPAAATLKALLDAGLLIDGSPSIYMADHAGHDFARYLPMSPSLL